MSLLRLLGLKPSSRTKAKGFEPRRESTANSETFILEPIYTPMGVVDTDGDDADVDFDTPIDIGNDAIESSPPDDTDNNDAGGDSEPDSSDTGGDESADSSDPDAIDVSENNADDVVDDDIGDEMDFIDPDGEAEGETGDSDGEDTADSDTSDNTVDSDNSNSEENQEDSTGDTEDSTDDSSDDAADTDNTDDTEDSSDDSSEETVGTDGGDETEDSSGDSSEDAADTDNTDNTEDSTDDNSEETAGDTDNSTDDGSEETVGTDSGDETEDSTDNSNDDDADTDDSSEETAGETDDSTDDSSEETVAGDSDETDDTATDNLDDGESDTESEDEGDDIVNEEEDDSDEEEEDDEATDKFELPNFESGVWTVGESGKVDIDFLHDGGAYQGDLGIFSLKGLEELTFETIEDFIAETAARVSSNSKLGYVAISDSTEGARFDGSAGEGKNWNSGDYRGVKSFEFDAGDRVGFMLVPNGSVSKVVDNPGIEGASRPLYSMSTANPDDEFHFGQVADVTGDGSTFVIEDVRADKNSDKDYNDVVFQVRGATGNAVHVSEVIDGDKDWQDSDLGQAIVAYSDPYVNPQPVQTPDAGETAGDGEDVASGDDTDTENGDNVIEDDTETEVTNTDNGGQTHNNSGADIGEINFPDESENNVDLGEENGSGETAIDSQNVDTVTDVVTETDEFEPSIIEEFVDDIPTTQELEYLEYETEPSAEIVDIPTKVNYSFARDNQPLIGIIDTGFAEGNPDINYENITFGTDFVDGDDNPLLSEGEGNEHGTHVLGQIAAKQDNGIGIDGINDDAPIWLGRAIGSGEWSESLVEFVLQVRESEQPNAVVNLSLDLTQVNADGSVTTRYELTPQERFALEYARQHNVLVVVAAGNDGGVMSALGQASQEFDNIITVGAAEQVNNEIALSESYDRVDYSSYGRGLDVVAPGGTVDNPILSTSGDGVGTMAGTSVAASKVTGTISQVWAANPELSYRQVIEIVKNTATDLGETGYDAETGAGLVNATAAVLLAKATKPEEYDVLPILTPNTWSGEGKVTPTERAVATEFMGKYYEWKPYTIQSGDFLSAIALRTMGNGSAPYYNFIAQYNGIANPDYIVTGQTIWVPDEVSAPSPPPNLNKTVGYDGTSTHKTYISTFNRNGGSSRLGSPTNNVHRWANGYTQDFSGGSEKRGAIMKSNANDLSYWVGGDFWNKFLDAGGADGILKYPTSDRYNTNGGQRQNFQGGAIIKSSKGIFPLFGGIGSHYLNSEAGEKGRLGFPTSGEIGIGNGVIIQKFEKGRIVYGDGPTRTEMTVATPTPTPSPTPAPTPAPTPTPTPAPIPNVPIDSGSANYRKGDRNPFAWSPGLIGQCTWFAYGRMQETGLMPNAAIAHSLFRSHAYKWESDAQKIGLPVTSTPKPGARGLVVWPPGVKGAHSKYGHVAFLEEVYPDGRIRISESNWGGKGISSRTLTPAQYGGVRFVQLENAQTKATNTTLPGTPGQSRRYIVRPGDTLWGIAQRELGNGNRWREIMKTPNGGTFTDAEAGKLKVGQAVYLPIAEQVGTGKPVSTTKGTDFDVNEIVNSTPSSIRPYAKTSIPLILKEAKNAGITDLGQLAYILATSEHESLAGRWMEELSSGAQYEGRQDLGNTQPGDGVRFKGRGYVQITGRNNYTNWSKKLGIDLVGNPNKASEPEIAAKIITQGMRDGSFTGVGLSRYINGSNRDFFNARRIVNGVDRAAHIAGIAERYYSVLANAKQSESNSQPKDKPQPITTFSGKVMYTGVNIRSGPGVGYTKTGAYKPNTSVTFDAWTRGTSHFDPIAKQSDNRWFRIKGTNKWVASAYINGNPTSSSKYIDPPSQNSQPINTFSGKVMYTGVNIRSGPGVGYTKTGAYKPNTSVTFDAWTRGTSHFDPIAKQYDNRWFRIKGTNKWVASAYINGNPNSKSVYIPPTDSNSNGGGGVEEILKRFPGLHFSTVKSVATNKALDAGGKNNSVYPHPSPNPANNYHQWGFYKVGDYYMLINKATGKALDGGGGDNGDLPYGHPDPKTHNPYQLWKVTQNGSGYQIVNKATGRALDSGGDNGNKLYMYPNPIAGNPYHQWKVNLPGNGGGSGNTSVDRFIDWAKAQKSVITRHDRSSLGTWSDGECVTLIARYIQDVFMKASERSKPGQAYNHGYGTAQTVSGLPYFGGYTTRSGLGSNPPRRGGVISFMGHGFNATYGHVGIVTKYDSASQKVYYIDIGKSQGGIVTGEKWISIHNSAIRGWSNLK